MTNVLIINGKEYIQSNHLAREFGYTSDYIGRLAREEKILATQVGRQWFVEPESLRVFAHQAQFEKDIRKEELRHQRKVEHTAHVQKESPALQTSAATLALAQLFLILTCGFFVGGLGWVATSEGLSLGDFKEGGVAIALLASQAFDPSPRHALYTESMRVETNVIETSRTGEIPVVADMRFAELPVFPDRTPLSTSSTTTLNVFSDEVEIIVDEEGNNVVRPIFKEDTRETPRFLLVPVNESTN